MLTSGTPLSTQLQTLPRLAHAAACRHAIRAPVESDLDSETPLGAYLEVNLTKPWIAVAVAEVLPQVMRSRPDITIKLQPPEVTQWSHDAEARVLSAIAKLTALRGLTIAGSVGRSCATERARPSAWLQCSLAGVPQLPSALCGLNSLERLCVAGLRVRQPEGQTGWAGRALQPLLAGCPQLTLLQLSNCQLRACDVESLHAALTAISGLQDLSLHDDEAGESDEVVAPICAALCTLTRLTKLCFSGDALPSCTEVWGAVARLSSLQQVT